MGDWCYVLQDPGHVYIYTYKYKYIYMKDIMISMCIYINIVSYIVHYIYMHIYIYILLTYSNTSWTSQFGIWIPTPQNHVCFFGGLPAFNALHGFLFGAFLHKASAIIHPFHTETGLLDQNITAAQDWPWVKGRHGFRNEGHITQNHTSKRFVPPKNYNVYPSELCLNLGVL